MPRLYPFICFLFTLLFLSTQLKANRVIVKGQISSSSTGLPIANKKVKISVATFTGSTPCAVTHERITNSTGVYIDTLECTNADITKVQVLVEDCKGQSITKVETVPSSKIIELNFSVCNTVTNPPATNCEAVFSFEQISSPFLIKFNSSSSHGTSSTDNIIKRRWKFGDGKILEGNEASPAHVYDYAGNYEVCLTINTAAGCEKSVCKMVQVVAPTATCKADFSVVSTGKTIKLNSINSQSSPGDIISRRWQFGDGKVLEGNIRDPSYEYAKAGIYEVCLTIKTNAGCESSVCKRVEVVAPTCKADFSVVSTGKTIKLNSINSQSSPGDIISRRWQFGDGKVLEGNIKDPSYEYAKAGTYEVCLTIKTNAGCESSVCKRVEVVAPTANQCAAKFSYEKLSAKKVRFNSSSSVGNSNSNIIERKWDFGDGTYLGGNEISPAKEYAHPGIYAVCLQIKTADKCDNRVCTTIHIEESSSTQPIGNNYIKIVSLHPNPATSPLTVVIWSLNNNVNAQLSIYDIYGVKKWSTPKVLLHGTNRTVIAISQLTTGPYFFKVNSMYGVQSKAFYKL